jgi:hypothetical protein
VVQYADGQRKQALVMHVQDCGASPATLRSCRARSRSRCAPPDLPRFARHPHTLPGGQAIFLALLELLHASTASVCVIVFSIPHLEDAATRAECIEQIRFQLDSFAVQPLGAPILLVGTRKHCKADGTTRCQRDAAALAALSRVLQEQLKACPAYAYIVRDTEASGESALFFGVENSDGYEGDATISRLVLAIERAARALPSMQQLVPQGCAAHRPSLPRIIPLSPPLDDRAHS